MKEPVGAWEISKSEYLHHLSVKEAELMETYLHSLAKLHQIELLRERLRNSERDGFIVKFWETEDDCGFSTETKGPVGFKGG